MKIQYRDFSQTLKNDDQNKYLQLKKSAGWKEERENFWLERFQA